MLFCSLILVITSSTSLAHAETLLKVEDPTPVSGQTSAAPTPPAAPEDSEAPVEVTPGFAYLEEQGTTYTLTLDTAATEGGLEQGQINSAVAAAYASEGTSSAEEFSSSGDAGSSGSDSAAGGGPSSTGTAENTVAPAGDGSDAGSGECAWRPVSLPAGNAAWGGNDPSTGSLVVNTCNGPATYLFVPNAADAASGAAALPPPPPPDPAVLAQQAYEELTLPSPVARRSPPETNSDPAYGGSPYTWVGLWTWFWVDDWQPVQRTVELLGVSATVTATPTALEFDPGDGSGPVTCAGQGRPWTDADGNEPPSGGGCGYVYRSVTPTGPVTASTSVRWSVAWTSNTGASGAYPDGSSTVSSSFLVEQIQVVVDR